MKVKILILFSILSFTLYGQENSGIQSRNVGLGVFYSPAYTRAIYRHPAFGYHSGIYFAKTLGNKFRVDCGISFSSIGSRDPSPLIYDQDGNIIDPPPGISYRLVEKHQFLEIPIKGDFFLVKNQRLNFYVIGGLSASYFLRTQSKYNVYKWGELESKGKPFTKGQSEFNGFLLGGILGIGMDLKLSDRWSFTLRPTIRRYFNENKPRSIGLDTGIILSL